MLRKARDIHSLFYLGLSPLLVYWQWRNGFDWLVYGLLLFLTLGVGVINHNHAHLRMWRSRVANRLTDIWIAILQGHPTYVFHCGHIANHHRYHHGERDLARTYRFGGDSNDLAGYLLHPFQAAIALYPEFLRWLARMRRHWPGVFRFCVLQYLLIAALWLVLAIIDWRKWLLFVFIPQLHWMALAAGDQLPSACTCRWTFRYRLRPQFWRLAEPAAVQYRHPHRTSRKSSRALVGAAASARGLPAAR